MQRRYKKSKADKLSEGSKIQEIFLNHCRKQDIKITLTSFDQLETHGFIKGFDQESIVVETNGKQALFYKKAIYSIKPHQEVDFIFNESWKLEHYSNNAGNYKLKAHS